MSEFEVTELLQLQLRSLETLTSVDMNCEKSEKQIETDKAQELHDVRKKAADRTEQLTRLWNSLKEETIKVKSSISDGEVNELKQPSIDSIHPKPTTLTQFSEEVAKTRKIVGALKLSVISTLSTQKRIGKARTNLDWAKATLSRLEADTHHRGLFGLVCWGGALTVMVLMFLLRFQLNLQKPWMLVFVVAFPTLSILLGLVAAECAALFKNARQCSASAWRRILVFAIFAPLGIAFITVSIYGLIYLFVGIIGLIVSVLPSVSFSDFRGDGGYISRIADPWMNMGWYVLFLITYLLAVVHWAGEIKLYPRAIF